MSVSEIIFWSAAALVVYAYVGYPILLAVVGLVRPRPVRKERRTPSVSIVVAAYNEVEVIGPKLENLLALDYPRDRFDIIVVSDGSTDGTDEIVSRFASAGVVLMRPFAERRGKAQILNKSIPSAGGEIVVLTDARQPFEGNALQHLVDNFADPEVGAVSGELHLEIEESTTMSEGISSYWRYEKAVRRLQSRCDSVIGATGAIYAIRRALFRPIPGQTSIDDVAIPMTIAMQGYRVVFEPEAKAYDRAALSNRQEWTRKVRTLSGNYALLFQMPGLLNPIRNRLFWQFLSHKVISRLLVPFALITALLANLVHREGIYAVTLGLQLAFYGLGVVGLLLEARSVHVRLLALPNTLLLLNASALAGLFHFLTNPQLALWEKGQSRSAE